MAPRLAPRSAARISRVWLAGGLHQAVGGAVLPRGGFLFDQRLDVAGKLDLRVAVVAARMAGQHRAAVNDAHLMRVGEHRQHAVHVRMGYGIVVEIEADEECLVRIERTYQVTGERVSR